MLVYLLIHFKTVVANILAFPNVIESIISVQIQ